MDGFFDKYGRVNHYCSGHMFCVAISDTDAECGWI